MAEFLKIECPHCKHILVIDPEKGKLIETRKPLVAESTGDRFKDAFLKLENDKKGAEEKFQKSKQDEAHKKEKLDELFQKSMKKVKESGPVEKGLRDIDLD